jgi:membrane protease YdiL (CAAX protease family)
MTKQLRGIGALLSLFRALLVVPWMFLWIIALMAALQLPVEAAAAVLVALTSLFVWRNVLRPQRSLPRTAAMFRLRPWRRYAGWLSVAALAQFAVAFATLILHHQLAEWRFLPRLPGAPDLVPRHFVGHPFSPVALFIAFSVMTPLVEEFAFRGKMQYRLERAFGLIPALAIPAVIFSLLHGVAIAAHHLPFALFVGWVVWRTGSIWTAVYVHALNNTAVLVLLYLTGESTTLDDIPPWLWPFSIAIGLLALGGLLVAARQIHRLAQRARAQTGNASHRNHELAPALRG